MLSGIVTLLFYKKNMKSKKVVKEEKPKMFKKIFTLLMYLTLILSLTACGGGSAINSSSDGNNSSVSSGGGSNVNLKSQIQNATQVLDYSNNSSYYDFDRIEFGLDKYHNPIKWIVLEKNDKEAFLLSDSYSVGHCYDESKDGKVIWKKSSLRKYLNDEIVNDIFTKAEQNSIITSQNITLDEEGKQYISNEKLFVLSEEEYDKYIKKWEHSIGWLRQISKTTYEHTYDISYHYKDYDKNRYSYRRGRDLFIDLVTNEEISLESFWDDSSKWYWSNDVKHKIIHSKYYKPNEEEKKKNDIQSSQSSWIVEDANYIGNLPYEQYKYSAPYIDWIYADGTGKENPDVPTEKPAYIAIRVKY